MGDFFVRFEVLSVEFTTCQCRQKFKYERLNIENAGSPVTFDPISRKLGNLCFNSLIGSVVYVSRSINPYLTENIGLERVLMDKNDLGNELISAFIHLSLQN